MKKKLSLGLVAVASVVFLASGAMGGSVFFSTVGVVGGGVQLTGPKQLLLDVQSGDPWTLYIWATADQDYDTTIGMNVVSDDPASVALSGAEVMNPELIWEVLGAPSGGFRWQDASVGNVSADQVSNMNAAHVTAGTGILVANDGTVPPLGVKDPLLDLDAGAFLLGSVSFDAVGAEGTSSTLSINQEGTALFVNAGEQVFPEFGTATINIGVIPEPSTLVLVAFGLIAMIGYGLKR